MEPRTWGIVGGVVFVIGFLYFFMGSSKSVEVLYQDAEKDFKYRKYNRAIDRYQDAIKVSRKPGAKTEYIDKDFPALANYKIALCYEKLGESRNDQRYYTKALVQIKNTLVETDVYKHEENLHYLQAQIHYKMENYGDAEQEFSNFINTFPNSVKFEEALYYDGIINKDLSSKYETQNSIQRNIDSQISFQRIIDEFPTSRYRDEAEYYIAQLLVKENIQQDYPDNKSEDQMMYDAVVEMIKDGKVYKAYQLLIAILENHPESPLLSNTYEKLGNLFYNAENFVNARKYYELARNSTTSEQRKQILIDKYHQALIVPEFDDVIVNDKLMNEHFMKAMLHRKERQYLEAAELYKTISNIEITSNASISAENIKSALYWGGYCFYKAAEENHDDLYYLESIELFNRLIANHTDTSVDIKTYFYLASAFYAISDFGSVIDIVGDAEKNDIRNMNSDYNVWYNQFQDLKQKAEHKINPPGQPIPTPNNKSPEEKLAEEGRNHFKNDEYEKATSKAREALEISLDCKSAIELLSDVRDRYYDLGWTFLDEEFYDYAIIEFEKCKDIDPNNKKVYCNLGFIYIMRKKYHAAIDELKQAIEIDKNYQEAHYNLGVAYLKLGQFDDAKDAANMAIGIDPNYEAAKTLRDSIAD